MHGYIGNANNDPATVQVLDDSDNWTASVLDTPLQTLADSIAYLRSRTNQCSNNWPNQVSQWSGSQVGPGSLNIQVPPVWDVAYQRWIAGMVSGAGDSAILQSSDGYLWTQTSVAPPPVGGTHFAATGIITRSSDGAFMAFFTASTSGNSGQFWPGFTSIAGVGSVTAGHWFSGSYSTALGWWIVWQGGSTGVTPLKSTNSGGTWLTVTTWSPPAGFTIHDHAHIIIDNATTTYFAIFPAGSSVTSFFMATTDGDHWAQFAMPSFTLSGEAVVDVGYDAFTDTIYLLSGTSSASHLWSSPRSAIAWTLVKTFSRQLFGLRANGRELLAWASFPGVGSSGLTVWSALVSIDGGVTWRGPLMPRTQVAPTNYFKICANGSQFIYCNSAEYAQSSSIGAPPAAVV